MNSKTEVEEFIENESHIPGFLERVMLADDPLMAQLHVSGGLAGIRRNQALRDRVVERFGYAVLSQEALKKLVQYGPFIEIGAGTGYWSYELQRNGCTSIPTDLHTPEMGTLPTIVHPFHGRPCYVDVIGISADQAVREHSDKSLLMVWPDLDQSWAYSALKKYAGNTLVYVGEGRGGWTGDNQLHDEIEHSWIEQERIRIPRFPVHTDAIFVYRRK